MLPPTSTAYLLSERPTNARSAVYGRAQPLGQPVMRTVSLASATPNVSSSRSSSLMTSGRTRSAYAMVGQNALDELPAPVRDVGDQEILLRREAHARAECLDDATNRAAQPPVTVVSDAP